MAKQKRYKNKFEKEVARRLEGQGVAIQYEETAIPWVQRKKYLVDFEFTNRGGGKVYVEAKGYLRPSDRTKLINVKKQHPELDIRLVFQRPENTLNKKSKTTYAQWAERHGFLWAKGEVPWAWINET